MLKESKAEIARGGRRLGASGTHLLIIALERLPMRIIVRHRDKRFSQRERDLIGRTR